MNICLRINMRCHSAHCTANGPTRTIKHPRTYYKQNPIQIIVLYCHRAYPVINRQRVPPADMGIRYHRVPPAVMASEYKLPSSPMPILASPLPRYMPVWPVIMRPSRSDAGLRPRPRPRRRFLPGLAPAAPLWPSEKYSAFASWSGGATGGDLLPPPA